MHLGADPDFHPAKKAHVAFLVSNVDELAERAQSEGYEVTKDTADGVERVYICDSFGNRLEFMAKEA